MGLMNLRLCMEFFFDYLYVECCVDVPVGQQQLLVVQGFLKSLYNFVILHPQVLLAVILQARNVFVRGIASVFYCICKYGGLQWTEFMGRSTRRMQIDDFVAVIQQRSCANR